MPGVSEGTDGTKSIRHQTPSMPSDCHPTFSGILFEQEDGITDTVAHPFVQEELTRFAITAWACR